MNLLPKILETKLHVYRAVCLFLALVIYAIWGSPTPDYPGRVEALIAFFLVCAVGAPGAFQALRLDFSAPLWRSAGQLLLLYGLGVGLLAGLAYGHDVNLIMRDLFPFFFMMMPVLLYGLYHAYPGSFKFILGGVCLIGFVFSLRAMEDVGLSVLSLFLDLRRGELTYLANMPTVLFTALLGFGYGVQKVTEEFSVRAAAVFAALAILAGFILLPLAMTTQRATLAYACLYMVMVLALEFYKRPYRAGVVLLIIVAAALPVAGFMAELLDALSQKTSLVGANARFEEIAAVWAEISRSFATALFGTGWGGTFESPAVAEIRVNFTHSLLSSALLKMGLAGLGLVLLYLTGLALASLRTLKAWPVFALALAGPIAIDVFLYASFKSLDFGLMLLLIPAHLAFAQDRRGKVANVGRNVYSR